MAVNNLCAVCFKIFGKKSAKLHKISKAIEEKIKTFIWDSYDQNLANHPKVICSNCYKNLYCLEKNDTKYLDKWLKQISQINRQDIRRTSDVSEISKDINIITSELNEDKNERMCLKCYGVVKSGIIHLCSDVQAVKTLVNAAYALGSASAERVASSILKTKMEKENIFRGEKFTIATYGKPLTIVAGTTDNKCDRANFSQVSFGTIIELIKCLELSQCKTKKMCSIFRKSLGFQSSIEGNIVKKLEALKAEMNEYFSCKEEEFVEAGDIVNKSMVYIKDIDEFIHDIITERNIDPLSTIVRVAVDSGQGFLKVTMNVFNPHDKTSNQPDLDDSGVKRCFIVAIVEGVSENNGNLRKLVDTLNLQNIKYSVAFDLKCANSMFGITSHAGKYSCLWCEGESLLDGGEKRTLGSLDYHYGKYTEAGKPKSKMADYKNVINPRLLYLEEDPDTIIENLVPVPELHTLIGIVTTFGKLLSKLWPGFEKWLNSNYIFFRGYHGIGFDGNNANRLLDKLDVLSRDIADQGKLDLLPVIECLRKFQSMKQATFGEKVGDIESVVFEFKMSYANLREYINTLKTFL
ncbi:uncharacterized protein LOC136087513 [Hydra vulgaris]|uniref:Uncharacterized protein LOC136087513 n=1 Tax=Hydra vulgaris TaxID=6087 RepID=A0ABM4CX05_HYDVU